MLEALAAGASPLRGCADVGPDGALVYASGVHVVWLDGAVDGSGGVRFVSSGRGALVRAVAAVPSADGRATAYAVAGYADGTLVLYGSSGDVAWCDSMPNGSSVVALAVVPAGGWPGGPHVVAASAGGSIVSLDVSSLAAGLALLCSMPASQLVTALAGLRVGGDPALVVFAGLSDNTVAVLYGGGAPVHVLRGHTRWVHGLAVAPASAPGAPVRVASASADGSVRVWTLLPLLEDSMRGSGPDELLPSDDAIPQLGWRAACSAVCWDHDAPVQSARFVRDDAAGSNANDLLLVTAAADHSVVVWDGAAGVPRAHLGSLGSSGDSGSSSQAAYGFFWAALLSADGTADSCGDGVADTAGSAESKDNDATDCADQSGVRWRVVASGSTGSIVSFDLDERFALVGRAPRVVVSGHVCGVPVAGEAGGVSCVCLLGAARLLTCGAGDRTTRLWALPGGANTGFAARAVEVARPQMHGHALVAVAPLADARGFVCAADEKVLRVFARPKRGSRVLLPGLGLSSRPISGEGASGPGDATSDACDANASQIELCGECAVAAMEQDELSEDTLHGRSLWPEADKLYGHGMEVVALAATPSWLASASAATLSADARIHVWRRAGADAAAPGCWAHASAVDAGFSLNATALCASPCGRLLLAGSRDRLWALLDLSDLSEIRVAAHIRDTAGVAAHRRAILSAAWAPDGASFVTGSRDGVLCLWRAARADQCGSRLSVSLAATMRLGAGVSAAAGCADGRWLAGLEDGRVLVLPPDLGGGQSEPAAVSAFAGPRVNALCVLADSRVAVASDVLAVYSF